MKTLAQTMGMSQRHIAHLLKLSWLAPDIIRAIHAGKALADLTLYRLKNGFPLAWDTQREELGFPAKTQETNP